MARYGKKGSVLGFINAVRALGRAKIKQVPFYQDRDLRLLQLPMLPTSDPQGKQGEIIVWLKVANPYATTLRIEGIEEIEVRDYLPGGLSIDDGKRRYCFKEPSGSNVTWAYSPIYRLGKPGKNSGKTLLGTDGRLAKLRKNVLEEYEKVGVFVPGSVDLIMEQLTEQVDRLVGAWSNTKRSYIMILGVCHAGSKLYPGDVPAFLRYYKEKIRIKIYDGAWAGFCAVCHQKSPQCVNLDQVFAFSTFDKPGFLPGATRGAQGKMFPVCLGCLSEIALGRSHLDTHFCDRNSVPGTNIYVLPELVLGAEVFPHVAGPFENFIKTGLRREKNLFGSLARRDEALVFHFLFWESEQSQERVRLMVEDVPPSHLKHLEATWKRTAQTLPIAKERMTLDYGLGEVVRVITSLAGKSENDKKVVQSYAISVIGRLLNGETVDVKILKTMAVARMSGLVHDETWLKYGAANARRLATVVDFLSRCGRRESVEA